jgi:translation initiation factor IF-3
MSRANKQILAPQVFVVAEDGEKLGVMDTWDAILKANEEGKDLVEVAPNANPPVCKIIELSKYQYMQKKHTKHVNKSPEQKEFRFGITIGDHDLQTKLNQITKLLQKGHPIKFVVRFFGREVDHKDQGFALLERIQSLLPIAQFDSTKIEHRSLSTTAKLK